jgi:hypothetical protein
VKEFNQVHLRSFAAHAGDMPHEVNDGIPCVIGESRFVPPFTVVAEYPDETIYGDAFQLAHTVQMTTVLEAAELLAAGELS